VYSWLFFVTLFHLSISLSNLIYYFVMQMWFHLIDGRSRNTAFMTSKMNRPNCRLMHAACCYHYVLAPVSAIGGLFYPCTRLCVTRGIKPVVLHYITCDTNVTCNCSYATRITASLHSVATSFRSGDHLHGKS